MKQAYDARLHHYFRKIVSELPYNQRVQLKNLELCGKRTIPAVGGKSGVFVLRNSSNATAIFGNMTCKNTWACPHCTATMMKKYATKISAAIDALREQGQAAFMLTLTIPHLKKQSCREVTDILYESWRDFFANAWKKKSKNYTVVNRFIKECGVTHYVRVAEYTYGGNGWHPHFHCLFWVPKQNLQKVADYEELLWQRWDTAFRRQYDKYASISHEIFRSDDRQSFNILQENGKVVECLTSDYICGWGADKELTGNIQKKASHSGHFTPYQMLEFAADGNENMKDLYIEFALQVTRRPVHHRVNFDKRGLCKIAADYMNTKGFKEVIAKKKDSTWKVVCFFTSEQWYDLCDLDKHSPIISNILYLIHIHKEELLEEFLESFGIELVKSVHVHTPVVEDIFNVA